MVIKISTNERQLAAGAILLVGMFSGYMGNPAILRYGLILVLLYLCVGNSCIRRNLKRSFGGIFLYLTVMALIIVSNVLVHGNSGFLGRNLRSIVYVFGIVFLVQLLVNEDSNGIFGFLEKHFVFINVFGVINLIITTIQIFFVKGFFIKAEWLAKNPNYRDLCCGLFGYSATHEMTYFFCFWMLFNLYEVLCNSKFKRRRKLILFTLCMAVWMITLSTQNDNIALMGIFGLFLIIYLIFYIGLKYKISIVAMKKYIKFFVLSAIVIGILLLVPESRDFILNSFIYKIEKIFIPDVSAANGSNERLAIVLYAIQNGYGVTGIGLGTHGWMASVSEGGFLGFNHFGLNSISSFITLGGFPFYLVCVLFLSWILWKTNLNGKSYLWYVCVFIIVVASSIYTVIFTSYISAIWLMLSMVVFSMTRYKLYSKRES